MTNLYMLNVVAAKFGGGRKATECYDWEVASIAHRSTYHLREDFYDKLDLTFTESCHYIQLIMVANYALEVNTLPVHNDIRQTIIFELTHW